MKYDDKKRFARCMLSHLHMYGGDYAAEDFMYEFNQDHPLSQADVEEVLKEDIEQGYIERCDQRLRLTEREKLHVEPISDGAYAYTSKTEIDMLYDKQFGEVLEYPDREAAETLLQAELAFQTKQGSHYESLRSAFKASETFCKRLRLASQEPSVEKRRQDAKDRSRQAYLYNRRRDSRTCERAWLRGPHREWPAERMQRTERLSVQSAGSDPKLSPGQRGLPVASSGGQSFLLQRKCFSKALTLNDNINTIISEKRTRGEETHVETGVNDEGDRGCRVSESQV